MPSMRQPSGNVTFLFTDIERSSQLWEMHPQSMGRALAQHDDLVRSALIEQKAYIFKTAGDAFCAAFENAAHAVRAAVAAQQALSAAPWEETGPLRVRMALHSGEAEQREGDYFGQTLNRVARVLAAGHGGQTLLTRVTAERVREKLPRNLSLLDLGERRLKDLSRPERIFQLVVPELPSDFPPLRSLEVLPNNLPAQVTSFVGRSREMADIKRLLGTTRLLTLTGPGGTGKTRLSVQVGADVLERYPHGVWLVELATISEPEQVAETIANAVDIREELGRAALDTLIDGLRSRQLLLILDNCEHLVATCAKVASSLLRRCPELHILATSREALNIEGETIRPVPPLVVGEPDDDRQFLSSADLAELESVQLFVERATAVRADFTVSPQNAALLARICWRLDGIPLAIELAAARVKVLSLEQILTRLDDRFRLLSGGSRAALPRQQTLGALIDWSYDLLSPAERLLLRRLSVFVAGRTLTMAEAVCSGDGLEEFEVFDLLSALVEKSLLTVELDSQGESRYTMLESVWDYADEKLTQAGEKDVFRRRHLEFFVRYAEEAEPKLMGPEQKSWLCRLHQDHHNLNMALRTSLDLPEALNLGLRLATSLTRYWEVRSYLTEGYEHFQSLLARVDASIPVIELARAERAAGRLSWCQDRDADALRHFGRARDLFAELKLGQDEGICEAYLGFTERNDGNFTAAREHFLRAQDLAEQHPSEQLIGMIENGLGSLAADEGRFEEARAIKEESLRCIRPYQDQWITVLITGSLGRVCYVAGDLAAAQGYFRESLSLARDLGNKWIAPYAMEALANIYAEQGDALRAARLYGAASAQREALALDFSPTEQATHQTGMARLHELLPDESIFQSAWNEGLGMGLHDAIDLALTAPTPARRRANPRPVNP